MAGTEGESSNPLFDELQQWNEQLAHLQRPETEVSP